MTAIPSPDFKGLGHEVARRRHSLGWSLDRLAEASGLDRRTIINIEGGHHPPKLSTVHAIAHALGVPLGVLVQVVCAGEDLPSNS